MTIAVADKMVALHDGLSDAGVHHAFGGALALAWCTEQARGTLDIDLNVFAPPQQSQMVLRALPPGVSVSDDDGARIAHDGQARLWWDHTPVDVFFSTTPFHDDVAGRVRSEPFAGRHLPFLSCRDLAVFKAMFNRTRDWADLESMGEAGTLDIPFVIGIVVAHLGGADERVERLRALMPRG